MVRGMQTRWTRHTMTHWLFFHIFLDQHFPFPVTPLTFSVLWDSLAPPQGLSSALRALATMSHPPAEFPFWVNSSIRSAPPWVTCSNKPSCRHTICCGIVGLALAWGEIAKFTTLFAHPQLAPATTKNHTPCYPLRHVHPILVPKGVLCTIGMSVWSTVFSFTQSAPCALCQITKSPHMHTGSTAFFPSLVHHSVPTIHLPINFSPFSCTQALPCMF